MLDEEINQVCHGRNHLESRYFWKFPVMDTMRKYIGFGFKGNKVPAIAIRGHGYR